MRIQSCTTSPVHLYGLNNNTPANLNSVGFEFRGVYWLQNENMKGCQYFYVCFIALQLFSCREVKKLPKLEVTLGPLAIDVSPDDSVVKARGMDSYVAYIINSKKDTFNIEYGRPGIIYSLHIASPPVFASSSKARVIRETGKMPAPDDVVFSDYPDVDYDQRIFEKTYWMYDTIHGIISKIVQPKKIGFGMTGLYIPRLKDGMSFSIYANNLDSNMHRKAIEMFKTVHYKSDSVK
jgi:hypothetical protein